MNKKLNKYLLIASISSLIYFGLGDFVQLPSIIEGICIGICLVLYPFGLYAMKHDVNKIKDFKRKLFFRIQNKYNQG